MLGLRHLPGPAAGAGRHRQPQLVSAAALRPAACRALHPPPDGRARLHVQQPSERVQRLGPDLKRKRVILARNLESKAGHRDLRNSDDKNIEILSTKCEMAKFSAAVVARISAVVAGSWQVLPPQ